MEAPPRHPDYELPALVYRICR